jgi:limonene-1,2-epoxide hydrolase
VRGRGDHPGDVHGTLDLEGKALAATDRTIEVHEVWVFDLDPNGLIVEERDYFDTAALLAQTRGDHSA